VGFIIKPKLYRNFTNLPVFATYIKKNQFTHIRPPIKKNQLAPFCTPYKKGTS